MAGVAAGGRSLWFYYHGPDPKNTLASLELQISFRDGETLSPMINCWQGDPAIFGPVADFVGDEAIAYDASRDKKPTDGSWIRARVGSRSFYLRDNGEPFALLTTLARSLAVALPGLPVPTSFKIEESEREQPNSEYIKLDQEMFARMTPKLLANPPDLTGFSMWPESYGVADLGFGYRLATGAASGGYLSLYASVLSKDGVHEALRSSAALPRAPAPTELYRELFYPIFGDSAMRYWNYARAAEPLPNGFLPAFSSEKVVLADASPDRATIEWLMTPFSGTSFGTTATNANRRAWNELSRLDANTCLYLLQSKNPVTRLTAVETLRRRAAEWQVDLPFLANVFAAIYQNPPKITTLRGCIEKREDSRALVDAAVASEAGQR